MKLAIFTSTLKAICVVDTEVDLQPGRTLKLSMQKRHTDSLNSDNPCASGDLLYAAVRVEPLQLNEQGQGLIAIASHAMQDDLLQSMETRISLHPDKYSLHISG